MAALAARAASGELAALQAQPDALSLCVPAFTNILSSTLKHLTTPPRSRSAVGLNSTREAETPPPVKGHSAVVQHWCLVVRVLVDTSSRHQIKQHLVSLLVRPFTAQHSSAAAAICVATMHLMPTLFDRLGLDMYMTHFHPHMMHMIVTSANQPKTAGSAASQSVTSSQVAASFERAQMTNAASTVLCAVVGIKLTLPIVLEHVIRPLLLALGNSPDVAVALIGVGGAIGGAMTALHVLPSLIMVLLSSSVSNAPGGQAQQSMPSRRRISEGWFRLLLTRQPVCIAALHTAQADTLRRQNKGATSICLANVVSLYQPESACHVLGELVVLCCVHLSAPITAGTAWMGTERCVRNPSYGSLGASPLLFSTGLHSS